MWKTKNHNVSETGSVSVLRWMGQDKPTQLGPLERASLNHWTMVRVQNKPNSSVQHTPSSESFQVYVCALRTQEEEKTDILNNRKILTDISLLHNLV
jgi:hypothetical protein